MSFSVFNMKIIMTMMMCECMFFCEHFFFSRVLLVYLLLHSCSQA